MNGIRARAGSCLVVLALLTGAACSTESTTDAGPTTSDMATSDTTGSSTTEAAAATTSCTAAGYTVEYPADWSTNTADQGGPCEWFHPEPFEIHENSEALDVAIRLRIDEVDYDFVSDPDNNSEEVLDVQSTEVDGFPATRMHTRSKGEGLLDAGVESVAWYVDSPSGTFTGATHDAAQPGIETSGPVLDEMIRSLSFPSDDASPPGD